MVKYRIVIGAILLLALFGVFWLDAWLAKDALPAGTRAAGAIDWSGLLHHGGLITLLGAALVLAATAELIRMCRAAGLRPAARWAGLIAVLLAVHPWLGLHIRGLSPDSLAAGILVIGLAGSAVAVMTRRRTEAALADVASTWFAAAYVGYLASFAIRLRGDLPGPAGAWVVLYFIAVVKFTDIFAYGTGMLIGRHRLIGWLSPGKTVEGLIGGLCGAAMVAVFLPRLAVIISIVDVQQVVPGSWLQSALLGVLLGGLGQVGDLVESLLKRGAEQKDSGRLLPGFGGIFDLLDSPLLAAPAAWVLLG